MAKEIEIDETRLLGKLEPIDMLYRHALDQSRRIVPPCLFFNALFYVVAGAMGLHNIRILRETRNRGEKEVIPNFFGISFGSSGLGKNHSLEMAKELFAPMFIRFEDAVQAFYESRNDNPAQPDKRYVRISSYFLDVATTEQGMQKAAQTISDLGYGALNITTDEIGDQIGGMDPIFKKLKTAWDDGIMPGPLTASDGGTQYFDVKNLSVNALLFGSPAAIELKSENKEKLMQAYVTGMTRRAFVYHNEGYKKTENKNPDYETMTREEMQTVDDYVLEFRSNINNCEGVKFPYKVYRKLLEYDDKKEIEREKMANKSHIAEFLGSIQKIEKLCGILAIIDLKTTVEEKHLEWAIEFTELIDKTTESTVEVKTNAMLICDELIKSPGFMARTELLRRIKTLKVNGFKDEITLAGEYASRMGDTLQIVENNKVLLYKIQKMTTSEDKNVIISINEDPSKFKPDGFERKRGNFNNLYKFVNSEMRYSAGTFTNNYISDANYQEEQNLFIIDVDDGMSIEEAKNLFSDWEYLISTTKSHKVEKNGTICDRFRIILPTESIFHLDPETYSEMYINVLNTLGIPSYDDKCRNASRWYYGNPNGEHWYNEGESLRRLDIRSFIPASREQVQAKQDIDRYDNSSYDGEISARVDGAIRWIMQNSTNGNRNDMLFRLAMLLKDPAKINSTDWESITRHVNTCLSDPLPDNELNTILNSANRR